MATPKKKTTTKPAAAKASTARKVTSKTTTAKASATRKTTKKPVAKSTTSNKPKVAAARSLHKTTEKTPFFTYRFTIQSLYWSILSVLVLVLGAWVMYLDAKIQSIYDQVEINSALNDSYVMPSEKAKTTDK